MLGIKPPKIAQAPKAFAVWWANLFRWTVSSNQATFNSIDLSKGQFPVLKLGTLVDLIQYGTSDKANVSGSGTAVIRMNNIKDGLLDLSDLKHITLSARDCQRLLLQDGDILFNRTNSKELVGKCAVFHETKEYVFASYLIRVRLNQSKALPDYVAFFLNSPIGRQQIDALSRHIIGQANVNSEELRGLKVCIPTLRAQEEIVDMVSNQRRRIAEERKRAEARQAQAVRDVEEMILGGRSVHSITAELA